MERQKSTILFLHSALGCSKDMTPLMELMKEKGHPCLSFNFSGHGTETQWPEEFRIDLFSRDLSHYLEKHHLQDVVIFGHSMGGYVALYNMANNEDSPISHIITYGTKFNWSEKSLGRELPMLDPDHVSEKFPHVVESLREKHGERWKPLLRSTAHMMQHLERLDGLSKEDVHDIKIPVTLILGDQDRMVTSEETHLAASWLHYAQVKTLAHSKHELERSNLKQLSEMISETLN